VPENISEEAPEKKFSQQIPENSSRNSIKNPTIKTGETDPGNYSIESIKSL
jgi:hypothetical protein